MAKAAKLKVFTTAIGFYDALVAASSRAAALRAWGSKHDLFARGMASEVTDPNAMAEPLAHPGEVIRRARGDDGNADGRDETKAAKAPPRRKSKSPRPSRTPVDEAERALAAAKERHKAEDANVKAKIEAAQRERREAQERATHEEQELMCTLEEARDRYQLAIKRWQGDTR